MYYRQTGRRYGMVEPYRMEDAEYALVGMGGMMETAKATADYMRGREGAQGRAAYTSRASRRSRPRTRGRAQGRPGRHRDRAHGQPAVAHAQPARRARSRPRSATPSTGRTGHERIDRIPKIYAGPPASAPATCAPATSSPRSKT